MCHGADIHVVCHHFQVQRRMSTSHNILEFQIDEVAGILDSMSLRSFLYEDYLIVVRSSFDVTIVEEPYIALTLLFNMKSGRFMARLWDQTVDKGQAVLLEQFRDACKRHFNGRRRLCLGCPQDGKEDGKFVISQTPMARKFSTECDGFLREGFEGEHCQECDKIGRREAVVIVHVNTIECEKEGGEGMDSNYPKAEEYLPSDDNRLHERIEQEPSQNGSKKVCQYCFQEFKSANGLIRHRKLKHFWGKFRCPKCNLRFSLAKDLLEHMRDAQHCGEPVKCPSCQQQMDIEGLEKHYEECVARMQTERKMCTTCGKMVVKKAFSLHLKGHLRAAGVSEHYFYCDQCSKRFYTNSYLQRHMKEAHEGIETAVTCPVCEKAFRRPEQLLQHTNIEHSTDERYQCVHCEKRCGSATLLKSHMLKHGDPKFKCTYCFKMLKTKTTLDAHERGHTGERPYE